MMNEGKKRPEELIWADYGHHRETVKTKSPILSDCLWKMIERYPNAEAAGLGPVLVFMSECKVASNSRGIGPAPDDAIIPFMLVMLERLRRAEISKTQCFVQLCVMFGWRVFFAHESIMKVCTND